MFFRFLNRMDTTLQHSMVHRSYEFMLVKIQLENINVLHGSVHQH